ncbi:MFS domain-containing protein [Fusarium sp. LHS14.1]|nr:MFS domain-containing protein [Fusarium sp. LHS14.1]
MATSAADSVPNTAILSDKCEMEDPELQEKSIEDGEGTTQESETSDNAQMSRWEDDPHNPLNWPLWKKALQVAMISSSGFLASIGTSVVSPARLQLMQEFNVSSTEALVPVALYVFALGFGPLIGGPLSETIGRYPIYVVSMLLGSLFTLGVGFTHNFGALCFLRFMAGLCWAPVLSVATGTLAETFRPKTRGPVSAFFVLMPFLGPALGPVIGSFIVNRKDWRWTQWTLIFLSLLSILLTAFGHETFDPVIQRRLAAKRGTILPPKSPSKQQFGTLFSFFAGVPYTFHSVYNFPLEHSGLVFLSIAIGCVFGLITIMLCNILLYQKQVVKRLPNHVPPEYRLYPALIGSIGLPVGLFWSAWTARPDVSWASPAAAIIPFAWGNLCVFVSTMQYISDTYHGSVVASGASANGLARYCFAGAFPLFTTQMYASLGVDWATSLLGFLSLLLLRVPRVLFRYGHIIRSKVSMRLSRRERRAWSRKWHKDEV